MSMPELDVKNIRKISDFAVRKSKLSEKMLNESIS